MKDKEPEVMIYQGARVNLIEVKNPDGSRKFIIEPTTPVPQPLKPKHPDVR